MIQGIREYDIRKESEAYGMIETLRERGFSENEIIKIIQKSFNLPEDTARLYLEQATDELQKLHDHFAFVEELY